MPTALTRPSELEMQVLGVLWDRGPSTVRAVLEAMPDGKERAYTTVLSVLQALEKKGLVDHAALGQAHVYRARVKRGVVARPVLKDLLRNAFGGSPAQAIQCLLEDQAVSEADLNAIREVIRQAEASNGGDQS